MKEVNLPKYESWGNYGLWLATTSNGTASSIAADSEDAGVFQFRVLLV
jgi:hypothetical protein